MPSAPDLHQIEYRHHQTKDLSPAASSMTSRETLAAWDSRIRPWIRHPHADFLSESACYQVLPNEQAALAWRYWSKQAAQREDGTHGRPLVSRVLVGPVSVLTPAVAIAACRAGLAADWAGPLPGKVPDDSQLPMVSGATLSALAHEMSPELDEAAIAQEGLQAVVAAALAEPSIPLAISMQGLLIQAPLRDCVQFPLLWGLHRVTGRLLGPDERGWSFSTFELPLGEMDPASLPAIVFREAKDGVKAPPARWRREVKVRPFEPVALDGGAAYAGQLALAGGLVTAYRERGGDWLEQFITERAGKGSLETRVQRVTDALMKPQRRPGRHGARPRARRLPSRSSSRLAPRAARPGHHSRGSRSRGSRSRKSRSRGSRSPRAGSRTIRTPRPCRPSWPRPAACGGRPRVRQTGSEVRSRRLSAPRPLNWPATARCQAAPTPAELVAQLEPPAPPRLTSTPIPGTTGTSLRPIRSWHQGKGRRRPRCNCPPSPACQPSPASRATLASLATRATPATLASQVIPGPHRLPRMRSAGSRAAASRP